MRILKVYNSNVLAMEDDLATNGHTPQFRYCAQQYLNWEIWLGPIRYHVWTVATMAATVPNTAATAITIFRI